MAYLSERLTYDGVCLLPSTFAAVSVGRAGASTANHEVFAELGADGCLQSGSAASPVATAENVQQIRHEANLSAPGPTVYA